MPSITSVSDSQHTSSQSHHVKLHQGADILQNHSFIFSQQISSVDLDSKIMDLLSDILARHQKEMENDNTQKSVHIKKKNNIINNIHKRSMPEIHMKRNKVTKLRICNDMNGILGINNFSFDYVIYSWLRLKFKINSLLS